MKYDSTRLEGVQLQAERAPLEVRVLRHEDVALRSNLKRTLKVVNLTFFPMHFLGLVGMPCRIPNYLNAYIRWNAFSSLGSYVFIIGYFCFFIVVFFTFTSENKCAPRPWAIEQDSMTLEWMIKSLLGFHRFSELPAIKESI